MLVHFRSFESAASQLPETVHVAGIPFFANCQDGFFYGRQGFNGTLAEAKASLFKKQEAGDLRVRFLCAKNCEATVVGVQCHKVETETFVPYRIVPHAPCDGDTQDQKPAAQLSKLYRSARVRMKIVEAGERSLRDRICGSCCAGGVATCCCCPCNTVACFTSQEVVTEATFGVQDEEGLLGTLCSMIAGDFLHFGFGGNKREALPSSCISQSLATLELALAWLGNDVPCENLSGNPNIP
eukprot:g14825.t1